MYDWLAPDRDVGSWFRRVPFRLERGGAEGSWVVKYFEFRAGIAPLLGVGFVGDLWVSWNPGDPSIWFKIEEDKWERWGGCASSVREVSLLFFSFFFCGEKHPHHHHHHHHNTPFSLSYHESHHLLLPSFFPFYVSRIVDPRCLMLLSSVEKKNGSYSR